jgi:hypothetical protein
MINESNEGYKSNNLFYSSILLSKIDNLQTNLDKQYKNTKKEISNDERSEKYRLVHDNYLGRGILAKKSFLASAFSKNKVLALQTIEFYYLEI